MTKKRYYEIRNALRFEMYATKSLLDKEYKAWKVKTITDFVRAEFNRYMPAPGQYISVDEGMGHCQCSKNLIKRCTSDKAIPVGFKFFVAVDYDTKWLFNFNVHAGE